MVHKQYLTPNEVAELLLVSPVTVRQWAQKGLLAARTTAGGHRRFSIDVVRQFAIKMGLGGALTGNVPRRILIVDDDCQLNAFLVELLHTQDETAIIESAFDGFEAGSKIQAQKPNILILDLMMPGMDGFQVCTQLKSEVETMHIHVVAMTGYYSQDNVDRILKAGADRFLRKPFSNREIFEACDMLASPAASF